MARLLLALMLLVLAAPVSAQQPVLGIDRIPVVVKDLARARLDFAALGFTLKPGRPHENGLHNAHVKFADGTEIELISPTTAVDELSSQYVDWLRGGDGPVSLGLYRPGSTNTPPPGVFFAGRQKSPTDLPEHFEHANGAASLSAVWLAGSPAGRKLENLPGAKVVEGAFCTPFGSGSKSIRFKEGRDPAASGIRADRARPSDRGGDDHGQAPRRHAWLSRRQGKALPAGGRLRAPEPVGREPRPVAGVQRTLSLTAARSSRS